MGVEDYAFTLLMMFSVVRQLRGRQLTWFGLAWPVVLVVYAACKYLGAVPRQGHNLVLVTTLSLIGLTLGLTCGRLSRVYLTSGETQTPIKGRHRDVMVRSTGTAAVLWVAGIGLRLVFALYAEHGGAQNLGRLSQAWQITSETAWGTALILMSLLEVTGRTAQLAPRLIGARRRTPETQILLAE